MSGISSITHWFCNCVRTPRIQCIVVFIAKICYTERIHIKISKGKRKGPWGESSEEIRRKLLHSSSCKLTHGLRYAPLSTGFPRQKHCSGLPFPPPGDLPDTRLLHLLPWQAGSLPLAPHGKPMSILSFGNPLIH